MILLFSLPKILKKNSKLEFNSKVEIRFSKRGFLCISLYKMRNIILIYCAFENQVVVLIEIVVMEMIVLFSDCSCVEESFDVICVGEE